MRTFHEHISPAQAVLIQWLALWQMACACARAALLAQKSDPQRAAREAEQLEVWSRFALFALLGQIAALGPPTSKEDDITLSHLRAVAGALAALCLLAARVKRECAQRAEILVSGDRTPHSARRLPAGPGDVSGAADLARSAPHPGARGYFDSG